MMPISKNAVAVLLLLATASQAETPPPDLGCAAWRKKIALSIEGTMTSGGIEGRYLLKIDTRSGRYVKEHNFGVFSDATGYDGKTGWFRDRSGSSHDMNAEAARAITRTESWIFRHGWCDVGKNKITPMPDETSAAWQFVPPGGVPVILKFDRKSGELLQSEYRLWSNRVVRHYEDWRDIGDGMRIAFVESDEDPEDEEVENIVVTAAQAATIAFPAPLFKRPAPPTDYEIRRGARSTTVPYEDDGGARIYVPVFVGDRGPFAFEIDTGGHLIFGQDLATNLQLTGLGSFANTGSGTGIVQASVIPGQEIRIGDAVIHRQAVKIRSFVNDRPSGKPPRSGLLGLELFTRFAVTIDRAHKTVTLTPLERFKGGKGVALPIHFIEDAPLTKGSFDGVEGDIEIDSGNAGPTIIEGYWAKQHGIDTELKKGLHWSDGHEDEEWDRRGDLTLGSIELPHEVVKYVGEPTRGAESTRLQAGLIGEWALRRFDMTYDYRRGTLWIGPRHDGPDPPSNHAGLLIKTAGESMLVTNVLPNSPADAVGIKSGDKIVSISGNSVSTLSARDVTLLLRGAVGSDVALITASATGETKNLTIRLEELLP